MRIVLRITARVENPYENGTTDRVPLAAGLFVEAEIDGRRVDGVFRVPRSALADRGSLYVVDDEDRLRRRSIEVLRYERDVSLIRGGLSSGERISLLEPRLAREGRRVDPVGLGSVARRAGAGEPAS